MLMNIIMTVSLIPCMLLVFFIGKANMKQGKSIVFGVRIPKEEQDAERVKEVCEKYGKRYNIVMGCYVLFAIFAYLIPYISLQLTYWMAWFLVGLVVMVVPYAQGNKMLKQYLLQKQGNVEEKEIVKTDIKVLMQAKVFSIKKFILPVVAACLPILFASVEMLRGKNSVDAVMVVAEMALMIPFAILLAYWTDKAKVSVISNDSDINANYARAKKKVWMDLWVWFAWISVLYEIIFAVWYLYMPENVKFLIIGSIFYGVLLTVVICFAVTKNHQVLTKYETVQNDNVKDDNKYWVWGMFYYNPKDKHTMVDKRFGVGTTINLATKAGKSLTIFTVLVLILCIPVLCGWLILLEFTPMSLTLSDGNLVAKQVTTNYEIPVEDMEHVELLTELPRNGKSAGTAMDNFDQGKFYLYDYEKHCEFFLNPQNSKYIQFEVGDKLYVFSADTDEKTEELYEEIMK